MRIDLHTHSNVSDGTQTPTRLLTEAAEVGLDVIALTDHDTVAGWAEAQQALAHLPGLTLVRGIELSCSHRGKSVHLLGYLFDPGAALHAELEHVRTSRLTRIERMVHLMAADGIPVSYADVLAQVAPGATVGRPHLADALVARGVVVDRNAAFDEWLHNDSRYYVSHYALSPQRAVQLVTEAGGVTVLAHPFAGSRGVGLPDKVIADLASAGLAGIEVNHRDHDPAARMRAARLADELGLLPIGSSDYHGTGKPNLLGENTTAPAVCEELVARATSPIGLLPG